MRSPESQATRLVRHSRDDWPACVLGRIIGQPNPFRPLLRFIYHAALYQFGRRVSSVARQVPREVRRVDTRGCRPSAGRTPHAAWNDNIGRAKERRTCPRRLGIPPRTVSRGCPADIAAGLLKCDSRTEPGTRAPEQATAQGIASLLRSPLQPPQLPECRRRESNPHPLAGTGF
jgi:hypothetical protein